MAQPLLFWEVVEAADQLSKEEQEALLDVLRRRLAAQGRAEIVAAIQEAREEIAQGKAKIKSVDEIMRDVQP